MIRSMTGYGRSETATEKYRLVVELKSVNHRYFDLSVRMPRLFNRFEAAIRAVLKAYMERGKVDLSISYDSCACGGSALKYNRSLAEAYLSYCREMSREFGVPDDIRASVLARFPDVLSSGEGEIDEDALWRSLEKGLHEACATFVCAREAEGETLKGDILGKLSDMRNALTVIEARAPQVLSEYRNTLRAKIEEVLTDGTVDESRLAAELTIYADRICVDEEMVRLRSHIAATEKELMRGGAVGRKLDFIAQEMNREANTTLSKVTDLTIADTAILLKTTIEKIREQIQNLE
ncbi:MAG: YicC/YloC family endoribonuclease [Stomatobaculum sp.]